MNYQEAVNIIAQQTHTGLFVEDADHADHITWLHLGQQPEREHKTPVTYVHGGRGGWRGAQQIHVVKINLCSVRFPIERSTCEANARHTGRVEIS